MYTSMSFMFKCFPSKYENQYVKYKRLLLFHAKNQDD